MATDYLLIGGGVAADNAAKKIRRRDAISRVVMVTADAMPLYDLPSLSKEYLRGEKTDADILFPQLTSLGLTSIDLVTNASVVALDVERREAHLHTGETLKFAKALLAPGALPVTLRMPAMTFAGSFI